MVEVSTAGLHAFTVLVVDDDPDIRTIIAMSLSLDPAITVHLAASAFDAAAQLDKGLQVDLMLIDVKMPGMSGTQFVEDLLFRTERQLCPAFIYLTTQVRDQDRRALMASGVKGIIPKPFDPLSLAQRLRDLIQLPSTRPFI